MEAPAASEGQPQLVQDFFDTIEEAGLSDIAAEVGLVTGQKGEPTERPPAEAAPPPAQVAQVDQGLAPATASTPAPTCARCTEPALLHPAPRSPHPPFL